MSDPITPCGEQIIEESKDNFNSTDIEFRLQFLRFFQRLWTPSTEPAFLHIVNYQRRYRKSPGTPTYRFYEAFLPLLQQTNDFSLAEIMPTPGCSTAEMYHFIFESLVQSPVMREWNIMTVFSKPINDLINQPTSSLAKYRTLFWSLLNALRAEGQPLYLVIKQAEYLKAQALNELRDLYERCGLCSLMISDHDGFKSLIEKAEGVLRFTNLAEEAVRDAGATTSFLEDFYQSFENMFYFLHGKTVEEIQELIQALEAEIELEREKRKADIHLTYRVYDDDDLQDWQVVTRP